MTPKISIVIPSYNKVKFIEKTLESIFKQNYPNLEVFVQDGKSDDGTLEIVEKYQKKYPDILKFESKVDGGQLNAVNIGMSKLKGDLVTFINADDCYIHGAFNAIAEKFTENSNALWFAGNGIVVNENDLEIAKIITIYKNILTRINKYFLLLSTNYLIQPSVFVSRSAYEKYGPFTGTNDFIMEYNLWLTLGKHSMPVLLNQSIAKFRIEPSTKTKTMFGKLLKEDEKIVKKHTTNNIILLFHWLNNLGRRIVSRFV